jgi:hypothetical protein
MNQLAIGAMEGRLLQNAVAVPFRRAFFELLDHKRWNVPQRMVEQQEVRVLEGP